MIFEELMAEIRNRVVLRGIESEVSQNQGANYSMPGNIAFRGKKCFQMKGDRNFIWHCKKILVWGRPEGLFKRL